ncbi:MAG: ferredoxin [Desulfovibrio sp.]|uniref:ATP-binding protein n=1 Tax=Desulfovibrio sp. TaxID=885 RepID=UPI001A6CB580|nr:ferredoxin [Desulfovibrio sp.]MBD5418244.1 ferredoxin [Desulfovibrio sp.]
MLRPIIEIDEEKCNGCGKCILDCAEGALAIVDGKARLISDVYCDGLGACLNCPQGALTLTTREAAPFDEAAALSAKEKREGAGKSCAPGGSCPGSAARTLKPLAPLGGAQAAPVHSPEAGSVIAHLPAWPVKLALVPPSASFLRGARVLLTADCAALSLPELHAHWLIGHIPLLACPKLEDHNFLLQRLEGILKEGAPSAITVLRMSVPCCGLDRLTEQAIAVTGSKVPLKVYTVELP